MTIKNIVACFLLSLFAISITPKQLLHDAVTGHRHSYAKFERFTNFQSSKNNFQCGWHNQVIESPFTVHQDIQLVNPLIGYPAYTISFNTAFVSTEINYSSLRGPPVA
jgi:hypothetical protein